MSFALHGTGRTPSDRLETFLGQGFVPRSAPMHVDGFIKLGFWSQLVLLFLVDWGTIAAFMKGPVPWYHYVGFCVVNTVLLYMTFKMWGWLRHQRTADIDAPDID